MSRVVAGARLHFGFANLSLVHERLYGALGVALDRPQAIVTASRADEVRWTGPLERQLVERAVDLLGVPGAAVTVERALPRHAGLGSGTQHTLAVLAAIARAYDRPIRAHERAPQLGRGGRSGVGVAAFERGGFVLDAGHPSARFTTDRPDPGAWTVPAIAVRHSIPSDWRFLVIVPESDSGPSGEAEDRAMRAVVERADPDRTDEVAGVLTRRLLPAIAEGAVERFGEAVAEVGRLNGAWYTDEQGGLYRPPVGELVAALEESPAVFGAGQSSWGPAVYGVTDADRAAEARAAAETALANADVGGTILVARGRNRGASIE